MINAYGCDRYIAAHRGICGAELSPATRRVANELLALADVGNGQVNMSWEQLAVVTGCENVNAARRHLSRLAAVGLVHYSTNAFVYVTWLAWMEGGARLEAARGRADGGALARRMDEVEAEGAVLFGEHDALEPARGDADRRGGALEPARARADYSHAGMLVSQSVDSDPTGEDLRTDRHPDSAPVRDEAEVRRSVALLRDAEVGVDARMAVVLARRYAFDELVRQVMTWRRQVKAGMVKGPGALLHRVRNGFGAMVTDQDRVSALYLRHCPAEEPERKKYSVDW